MSRRRSGALEFGVSIALALALLFLSTVLLARHDLVADLSLGQRRTLSPQTLRVLEMLERPVQITAFYGSSPTDQARFLGLVERYRERNPLIELRFLDVDLRPDVARELGVTTNGTVVLEDAELRVRLADPDEATLTAGLLRVLQAEPPLVLFTTGHGESSVEDESGAGLVEAARLLQQQNFSLRTINPSLVQRIPEQASAVIVAGPQSEFGDGELQVLDDYLMRGGRMLVAVEPGGARSVDSLLTRWGIAPDEGYLIDATEEQRNLLGANAQPLVALGLGVNPEHPITRGFTYLTLFPIARSLVPVTPAPSGVLSATLVETGQRAWLERTVATDAPTVFDEGQDRMGPLALGIAANVDLSRFIAGLNENRGLSGTMIEMGADRYDLRDSSLAGSTEFGGESFATGLAENARLVVFGDIDFASNANIGVQGNGDLFLSAVLWLTEQESRIALRARPELKDPFVLGRKRTRLLRWAGIGVVPALFFLGGAVALWRRRRFV